MALEVMQGCGPIEKTWGAQRELTHLFKIKIEESLFIQICELFAITNLLL
jgi:hypothetical protein